MDPYISKHNRNYKVHKPSSKLHQLKLGYRYTANKTNQTGSKTTWDRKYTNSTVRSYNDTRNKNTLQTLVHNNELPDNHQQSYSSHKAIEPVDFPVKSLHT